LEHDRFANPISSKKPENLFYFVGNSIETQVFASGGILASLPFLLGSVAKQHRFFRAILKASLLEAEMPNEGEGPAQLEFGFGPIINFN